MRRAPAPLPFLAGLLALYLVLPFAAGLAQSGLADWSSVGWPALGRATAVSVLSSTIATILVSLGGVPLGYLLARGRGQRMALLSLAVQLPLALPPLASGVLLLFLVGYASPLGQLTNGALTDSFAGIVLAEAFVAAPFVIIAARSAFAALDPVLEDVAATLGHSPRGVFLRVSLPLVWRAILAGMLLTWLRAFGEFGATVMVAYHPYSLPVFTYVAFGSLGLPAMLPVLLPTLLAAIGVLVLGAVIARTRPARAARDPRSERPRVTAEPLWMRSGSPSFGARATSGERSLSFAVRRKLDGFTLDVAWETRARRLAILGASGSGKSMTLRLIAGLDAARAGRVVLDGHDLSTCPAERRGFGYVPQDYGLFPHLTVAEQLRFAIGYDADRARFWTGRLGLLGLEARKPVALSLGQRQRVALARAFCRPTDLLLLDEPFSALDPHLRRRLRRALRSVQDDVDATTILVTHDPEEAFLLADEVLILDAGRVMQSGAVEAVFARPVDEATARLLGADNVAAGLAVADDAIDIGNGIRLAVAGPALVAGQPVGWSARPDSIRIAPDGPYPATLIRKGPILAGRQEAEVHLGDCRLRVALDPDETIAPGPCRLGIPPRVVQVWPTD